jgi:hypothetical protein
VRSAGPGIALLFSKLGISFWHEATLSGAG